MESPKAHDQSFREQIALARVMLSPRKLRDPAWPALAAAAFFAVSSMTFAVTAIMTPARDYAPVPEKHGP